MEKLRHTPASLAALAAGDLGNGLIAATPGGIERQEKEGQTDFVASATLPIDMNRATREQAEQMGIRFGEPVDDLFVAVALPPGWTKRASGHSMWSDLLDEKGRRRASIFYKAAFYDRKAHMRFQPFVYIDTDHHDADGQPDYIGEAKNPACKGVTHRTVVVRDADGKEHARFGPSAYEDYAAGNVNDKAAEAWLAEHFPDHANMLAYW